ncbi:DUF7507 domain-containing protein, partial [Streptomyces phytophilus]|uniref:DUF7507 domain-containing protein n=1 Tax=Streptomyces phytophilus TaxID=722715 RepID=UPI001C68E9E3
PIYVEEDFTGATAPEFTGYGSACLTGAAADDDGPTTGVHPLGGCPTPSAVGGPVPPPGADGNGYLQLTDAKTDQSGAALYDQPVPAEDGLVVTFEQWQYGPTAEFQGERRPADGISFFLVDGAADLDAPGAFGGSLGYAQKNDPAEAVVPGVDQGYVGIGLDVLGNFFNDGEGRGSGCPADQRSPAGTAFPTISSTGPNMVTVRGPGDGLEGYCFLDATYTGEHSDATGWESSLPGLLEGPTTEVSSDPVQAEADLEPSKRTVTVQITPAPDPVLTVWIDFQDGRGPQQVLSRPAPTPVPSTYKFGFAGSTGVWSNVHLIRNVVIGRPAPALSLVKSVPDDLPLPLEAGDEVPYTYTVTNTGNTELEDVTVTDDRLGPITCPQTTLSPGESVECTGTGTVTEEDAARGELTNTATATAVFDGQEVGPEEDSLTLPVRNPAPALTLVKSVPADLPLPLEVGDEVPYTYTVTNTGNTELEDVTVTDDRLGPITCPQTTLAPGESVRCTATGTVTEEDAARGEVPNTATATATFEGEEVGPEEDSLNLPVRRTEPGPALTLIKSVPDDLNLPLEEGDTVPYTFTVTNTGNTVLEDVTVVDSRLGPVSCPQTTLAPGESVRCTGTGTVTAEDAARGELPNTATATAVFDGQEVGPEEDSLNLPVRVPEPGAQGSITVNKVDAHNGKPLAGAVFELWRETNGVPGLQTRGGNPDTREGSGCATDRRGVCVFADLENGTYYLLETEVPDGFRLPKPPVTGPLTIEGDEHLTERIGNPRGEPCKGKGCKK